MELPKNKTVGRPALPILNEIVDSFGITATFDVVGILAAASYVLEVSSIKYSVAPVSKLIL
jgi:hypothetical protein